MKTQSEILLDRVREAAIDCFMIPNELLPESYRGKKSHRKLRSVVKQFERTKGKRLTGRDASVKFDSDREITSATPERLAVLEKYAADVAAEREIDYDIDESKLYNRQLKFCETAVRAGWFEVEEFENEEPEYIYENDL